MTVVAALIGAVGLIVAAVVPLLVKLRRQVDEVHVLVNSRLTEALETVGRLERLLRAERKANE